jgi:hypothetical protein
LLNEKRFLQLMMAATGIFAVFTLFTAPLFSMIAFTREGREGFIQVVDENPYYLLRQASASEGGEVTDEGEPNGEVVDEPPPTTAPPPTNQMTPAENLTVSLDLLGNLSAISPFVGSNLTTTFAPVDESLFQNLEQQGKITANERQTLTSFIQSVQANPNRNMTLSEVEEICDIMVDSEEPSSEAGIDTSPSGEVGIGAVSQERIDNFCDVVEAVVVVVVVVVGAPATSVVVEGAIILASAVVGWAVGEILDAVFD